MPGGWGLGRFKREAHLLAALNHPNIAAICGLEESDGKPFLPLELVEGEDTGTIADVIPGAAAYMSPEQARGKPVDRCASAEGQRFLLKLPVEQDRKAQLNVVTNWTSLLQ